MNPAVLDPSNMKTSTIIGHYRINHIAHMPSDQIQTFEFKNILTATGSLAQTSSKGIFTLKLAN